MPDLPPKELTLFTLNTWGLKHISPLITERTASIATHILSLRPQPSILAFQELFTQSSYTLLRDLLQEVYPHGKYYHSGAFGAGLVILSCFPIEESCMIPYTLNGRPTAFWRGDWYVGKGIAHARIRFGPGEKDIIDVFNTHTHAAYGPETYTCHRTAQAWQLAKLLRTTTSHGTPVALLGDLNFLPGSLSHKLITSHGRVHDTWQILHPDSSLGPATHPRELARKRPIPTAQFNLVENGATSNNILNTYRWTKGEQALLKKGDPRPIDPDTPDPRGQRLDYVFFSTGRKSNTDPGWIVKDAQVCLTERHPKLHVSLSDHFAVQATLAVHSPAAAPSNYNAQLSREQETLSEEVFDEILSVIEEYTARELKQQHWRGIHFYLSVALYAACLVAIWFSPRNFVAFIIMFLVSLNLVAGVIDGLLALLFFTSELGALKEFEWDIRNTKALASKDHGTETINGPET